MLLGSPSYTKASYAAEQITWKGHLERKSLRLCGEERRPAVPLKFKANLSSTTVIPNFPPIILKQVLIISFLTPYYIISFKSYNFLTLSIIRVQSFLIDHFCLLKLRFVWEHTLHLRLLNLCSSLTSPPTPHISGIGILKQPMVGQPWLWVQQPKLSSSELRGHAPIYWGSTFRQGKITTNKYYMTSEPKLLIEINKKFEHKIIKNTTWRG